jgi:hypothetical protein
MWVAVMMRKRKLKKGKGLCRAAVAHAPPHERRTASRHRSAGAAALPPEICAPGGSSGEEVPRGRLSPMTGAALLTAALAAAAAPLLATQDDGDDVSIAVVAAAAEAEAAEAASCRRAATAASHSAATERDTCTGSRSVNVAPAPSVLLTLT